MHTSIKTWCRSRPRSSLRWLPHPGDEDKKGESDGDKKHEAKLNCNRSKTASVDAYHGASQLRPPVDDGAQDQKHLRELDGRNVLVCKLAVRWHGQTEARLRAAPSASYRHLLQDLAAAANSKLHQARQRRVLDTFVWSQLLLVQDGARHAAVRHDDRFHADQGQELDKHIELDQ